MAAAALRIEDYIGEPPDSTVEQLASASGHAAAAQAQLDRMRADLGSVYVRAQDLPPELIQALAVDLLRVERQAAEKLGPRLERAHENSELIRRNANAHTATGKSAIRLATRAVDLIAGWLEEIRDMRIKMHLLASEKMRAAGEPDVEIAGADDLDRYFRVIDGR